MTVSPLYLSLIGALDALRRRRRLSMATLDDMAGIQDGYFAKALHADTPSGRQATWATLDLIAQALAPMGLHVAIVPSPAPQRRQAVDQASEQMRLPLDLPEASLMDHLRDAAAARRARPPRKYRRRASC